MEMKGIGGAERAGRTVGVVLEDIIWAVGISVIVLGLAPLMAVYVLLIA
jgi:hypothetical protein